jgi:phosphoglycerate dehydrogenase-like enzyme
VQLIYCGYGWLPIVDYIAARLPAGSSIRTWDRKIPLVQAVADIDVLLPSSVPITAEIIAAAPRLRLIQQPAAGIETVDRAAAARQAIPICNAPRTNHIAVAELALYYLLALARRVRRAPEVLAARQVGVPLGIELNGKTLGIVGMGNIGGAVAERAIALGMNVIALHRGQPKLPFFSACDAVSIHCPLTVETRHLVDHAALAAMRPGALLVNCSRADVIDRAALERHVDRLGGIGIDVLWDEPGDPNDPLYQHPNVIALPHMGGSTEEAFTRIADVVIENLARLERGEPLINRVA